MRVFRNTIVLGITVALLAASITIAGCATKPAPTPAPTPKPAPTPTPAPSLPKANLTFDASSPATLSYTGSLAWGQVVKKHSDGRITITTVPRKGSQEAAERAASGGGDHLSAFGRTVCYDMSFGKGLWEGKPNPNAIGPMFVYTIVGHFWVVLDDSPIKDFYDLEGKKVWTMDIGSGAAVYTGRYLEAAGLEDKVEVRHGPIATGADQLKDGVIDCLSWMSGNPEATLAKVGVSKKYRLLPVPADLVDKANAKYYEGKKMQTAIPFAPGIINPLKAVGYVGPDEVISPHMPYYFGANLEMPDDVAYEITKIFWEHFDEVVAAQPRMEAVKKEYIPQFCLEPYTPIPAGSLKYYKEIGLLK